MKILILGSTFLTQLVVERLKESFDLVGYVPSEKPIFRGEVLLPEVSVNEPCDIKLSIQYDKKLKDTRHAYNLHTGLLPDFGGCDILYHSIKQEVTEQGLTFHSMTPSFDKGGIISTITYPVFDGDTVLDLYKRVCAIAPDFTVSCLNLLDKVNKARLFSYDPIIYKRGDVMDTEMYSRDKKLILNFIKDEQIRRRTP